MTKLFEPLTLRGVVARNRTMVSPMCMYAASDGCVTDYHLVHLGRFALGGAGIVMVEATAIEPSGRISHGDLGLWGDHQVPGVAQVARFLSEYGAVPGIQLAHAGRKAACRAAWRGGAPLDDEDVRRGEEPWQVIGPSPIAAGPGWQTPREMSADEIDASIALWAAAARRAVEAGFRVIELHGGHGYLLHAFQSPISNKRDDSWGGDEAGRNRYPLAVVAAVRRSVGDDVAIFYRVSATDGLVGGLTVDDTVRFAKELKDAGVDLVDVSSGGISTDRTVDTRIRRGYGFHTELSRAVRLGADMPVATVGLIVDPHQAEAVLSRGDADVVALGREMLENSQWPHHARTTLLGDRDHWHREVRWALELRAHAVERLVAQGQTPMSGHGG